MFSYVECFILFGWETNWFEVSEVSDQKKRSLVPSIQVDFQFNMQFSCNRYISMRSSISFRRFSLWCRSFEVHLSMMQIKIEMKWNQISRKPTSCKHAGREREKEKKTDRTMRCQYENIIAETVLQYRKDWMLQIIIEILLSMYLVAFSYHLSWVCEANISNVFD